MVILLMGVTGAGKTTIGTMLSQQLGWKFADADSFHPPSNVEKMRHAIPLTDSDRGPWLQAIHRQIIAWNANGTHGVLTCSALKKTYRKLLFDGTEATLVYLKGREEVITDRVATRKDHFAPAGLVASQFADLEEPDDALVVQVNQTPARIVAEIRTRLGLR